MNKISRQIRGRARAPPIPVLSCSHSRVNDDGRGGPAQNPVLLSDHFNALCGTSAESMGSMVVIGSKLGYSLL